MQNEVKREIIEDRQLIIPGDSYNHEHVAAVPPREQWSVWNPPTMREAKRAYRQIELYLRKGDSSLEWFEGWATKPNDKPAMGILSFGSFDYLNPKVHLTAKQIAHYGAEVRYGWDSPERRHRSAFKSWLYDMAEKLGYEATDQDQTDRCFDCQLAIDSGSSQPDRFSFVDGEGLLCELCCNKDPENAIRDEINLNGIATLNWEPTIKQSFDYENELLQITFKDTDQAVRFASLYAHNRMAIQRGHYSWDTCHGYVFAEDLNFQTKDDHDEENPNMSQAFGQDTWTSDHAIIEWKNSLANGLRTVDRQRQNEAWDKIMNAMEEDKNPLLYWLAQGWIDETPIFQSDKRLLDRLVADLEIIREDLGIELTELDEEGTN